MRLNRLSRLDKEIFLKYLAYVEAGLSAYSFVNIYIWSSLFDIYWTLIEDNLCIFFKDKIGMFMYLPPLGRHPKSKVIEDVFGIMDGFNNNPQISRIENVTRKDLAFYQRLGYEAQGKYPEYLCLRSELAALKGNAFKSKRAVFNYFTKHYAFEYLPFSLKYRQACITLYEEWMHARAAKYTDSLYRGMLEDSRSSLKTLLKDCRQLDIIGRIVKIESKIKAFTFGFQLEKRTFCILYEIADLSIKGLAQFIFRKFCLELDNYKYINIMDDSGLDNLKQVKQSFHPKRLIPAYIIKRKDG